MRPGFWTTIILLIPGVRRAYEIAEQERLRAATLQGENLALHARVEALEAERNEVLHAEREAMKMMVNVYSQHAGYGRQFHDVGGMPEQFQPRGGHSEPDSVNASSLVSKGNAQARTDFFAEAERLRNGSRN